ncbi:methylated-DNA--[protein]-cysteine S-methyltransferase [bacterium]|nr:methylated-DNA--[protein]-cysteine S-methyltransferase [bacterium]
MRIDRPFYELVTTRLGPFGIVWWQTDHGPRVRQTLLKTGHEPIEQVINNCYPRVVRNTCQAIQDLANRLKSFLQGDALSFDLENIALEICSSFQYSVLMAEYAIPRGWVSSYGRIANHIRVSGGGRAVGHALATNPFPIIIPCHRAVRMNGELGGYQGGSPMKRALLAMEGVEFDRTGKVMMKKVFY